MIGSQCSLTYRLLDLIKGGTGGNVHVPRQCKKISVIPSTRGVLDAVYCFAVMLREGKDEFWEERLKTYLCE